ncbi:hypothetical protein [Rhizobium sp. L245/93]|uniref:hypothetical protein n=1 Tax=Rhizobium sp. L245/93 TaxID=2819998 RepID=UPI001ADCBCC7|nr:hypothetical protein [Rhizobium sp. L245/93]MBO9166782.1 hypothetical protein [Rhizobium sp. L245/93]
MKQIAIEQLQPNQFYWARRTGTAGAAISGHPELEIVRISTVFGTSRDYWAVAVTGSDEHFDLEAFEYLHKIPSPLQAAEQHANLTLISVNSRHTGH